MSNKKKSEHTKVHLGVSNKAEDDSFGQVNGHVNLAFQNGLNDHEPFTNPEFGKSNGEELNLMKMMKPSSPDTQDEEDFVSVQSSLAKSELQTVVKWENLEVEVTAQGETKKILENISGQTTNLELLAIMGPSGAGKTTLLNILAGLIRNYKGTAKFYSNDKKIGFAYVPQVDQLAPYLTVKESLMFASKFKNPINSDHKKEVDFVIDAFNLNSTRNHYSSKCSGGERKRLSIALEMISRPKILLLDEPTTGLDSTTAYQVIEVLKKINKNTAMITTIHQPNTNLFSLFDRIYLLTDGKCIYNDSPANVMDHLREQFDILLPKFTNPADYILDIANNTRNKQGLMLIEEMVDYEREKSEKDNNQSDNKSSRLFFDPINEQEVELREVSRSSLKRKHHFFREYYLNIMRILLSNIRDPLQTFFRALNNINFPIILYLIQSYRVGSESGCTFLALNDTHVKYENTFDRFDRQIYGTRDVGSAVIDLMSNFFSAMLPATICLAQLIRLLRKEHLNAYYAPNSYLFAILTVNTLFAFLYALLNTTSYFLFTVESTSPGKILKFLAVLFFSGVLGDLFGLFASILYPDQFMTGLVAGSFIGWSLFEVAGFFIPFNTMTDFVKNLSAFAFTRHLFEALVRTLYGGSKCRVDDNMIFSFNHLKEYIEYYNYEEKANLSEFSSLPVNVKEALSQTVWNRSMITDYVVALNDLDKQQIKQFDDFWDYKTSYILNSFSLNDPDMTYNFLVILTTIALWVFVCYFLMKHKLKTVIQ